MLRRLRGRYLAEVAFVFVVLVMVRRGLVRPGRVIVNGRSYPIRRLGEGWYLVGGASPADSGRARHWWWRDDAVIDRGGRELEIRFKAKETMFEWDGRPYRLGSMFGGDVKIDQAGRPVLLGGVAAGGAKFEAVASDFDQILRELTFVLALRFEGLWKGIHLTGTGGEGPGYIP